MLPSPSLVSRREEGCCYLTHWPVAAEVEAVDPYDAFCPPSRVQKGIRGGGDEEREPVQSGQAVTAEVWEVGKCVYARKEGGNGQACMSSRK